MPRVPSASPSGPLYSLVSVVASRRYATFPRPSAFFSRLNNPSALSCLTLDPSQSISSTSAIPLRRRAHRQYHLLHTLHPHLLHRGTHSNCHVVEKWRVALIGSVAVTGNVGSPFVFCGVGMPGSNVLVLEGLELLLGTQFVGHSVELMQW